MSVLDRVLATSHIYELSRRLIGARNEMDAVVNRYVRPAPGSRLLDFGCGNGRLVPFVPDVRYIGVDNNESYIDDARRTYGSQHAEFICGDLFDLSTFDLEPFDYVLSIGVLHHLDDNVAETALSSALSMLKPAGRLVTMDPCFEPAQHPVARVLMALDRGRFVRHPDDYRRLVERAGGVSVGSELWTDVYRFPYTHYVQTVSAQPST